MIGTIAATLRLSRWSVIDHMVTIRWTDTSSRHDGPRPEQLVAVSVDA